MKTEKEISLTSGIIVLIMFVAAAIAFFYLSYEPIKFNEDAIQYFKRQVIVETPDIITMCFGCFMLFLAIILAKKLVKKNNDYMRRKEAGRGNNY